VATSTASPGFLCLGLPARDVPEVDLPRDPLLALLLIQPGRPVAVDSLVEELWNGEPTPGAETTMRAYVSKLRRVLGAEAPITGSIG